jgi:SAM-dependent methyltransferase
METYGPAFARAYSRWWGGFAGDVAPAIHDYYVSRPAGPREASVLDLCCGAGHLALHFLERGYRVVGVDRSAAMLHHARRRVHGYVETGQAELIEGDAAAFTLARPVGLAVSTFDALNHLESLEALARCFACVAAAVVPAGVFVFDLNTRKGLRDRWIGTRVQENDEGMFVTRGSYDGVGDRATMHISGFIRGADGHFERFAETHYNTIFALTDVHRALRAAGWPEAHFARLDSLSVPLDDPEQEGRVFVVAGRGV